MEFELHLFEPVGYVFTINALDKDGPLMGVVGIHSSGASVSVERLGNATIDLRLGVRRKVAF